MLKVGRCNEHGIDIVAGVEFSLLRAFAISCPTSLPTAAHLLLASGSKCPTPQRVEVEFFGVHQERRNQRLTATVGVAHDADTYSIVGAENLRVLDAFEATSHQRRRGCCLHEIPA